MPKFEILCVTMHQNDFSKLSEMNIHSNVVFANQSNITNYEEFHFDGNIAKMITTNTRGVGINRNLSLMYASGDICLLSDDDMCYVDNLEEIVCREFEENSKADVIIFNVETDKNCVRPQIKYTKTRKVRKFERMPWGGVRIAFRLSSVRKANVFFTTLFGGGAIFASGEDSLFLKDLKKAGLNFYVSKKNIGRVSFETSSWYSGRDEKLFYSRGAYIQQLHPRLFFIFSLYYAFRLGKNSKLKFFNRIKWMNNGRSGFMNLLSYNIFVDRNKNDAR